MSGEQGWSRSEGSTKGKCSGDIGDGWIGGVCVNKGVLASLLLEVGIRMRRCVDNNMRERPKLAFR